MNHTARLWLWGSTIVSTSCYHIKQFNVPSDKLVYLSKSRDIRNLCCCELHCGRAVQLSPGRGQVTILVLYEVNFKLRGFTLWKYIFFIFRNIFVPFGTLENVWDRLKVFNLRQLLLPINLRHISIKDIANLRHALSNVRLSCDSTVSNIRLSYLDRFWSSQESTQSCTNHCFRFCIFF